MTKSTCALKAFLLCLTVAVTTVLFTFLLYHSLRDARGISREVPAVHGLPRSQDSAYAYTRNARSTVASAPGARGDDPMHLEYGARQIQIQPVLKGESCELVVSSLGPIFCGLSSVFFLLVDGSGSLTNQRLFFMV